MHLNHTTKIFWNKSFKTEAYRGGAGDGQRGRSTAVSTALEHTNHNFILAQIAYKTNELPNLGISSNT